MSFVDSERIKYAFEHHCFHNCEVCPMNLKDKLGKFECSLFNSSLETYNCVLRMFGVCSYEETGCERCKIKNKFISSFYTKNSNEDNKWIPADKTLPDERTNPYTLDYYEYPCTVWTDDMTDVRYYKFGKGHWWCNGQIMDKYVKAWMPFPKPYEGEEQ